MTHSPASMPFTGRLALPLLLLGVTGAAAAWILLALFLGAQCSWMAPLAALDVALLLRLGGMAPGWRRAAWALVATAATVALANWGIAATQIGLMMGLGPVDSALRMGASLAWTLVQLANGPIDLAWFVGGLLLAWFAGR